MATITFDTHKLVKQLEASGVPLLQAEVMIDVFRAAQDSPSNSSR
jgi:hypothetical protein